MNFNIKRDELLPGLQCVGGNIDRRQTLPILSNLLFNIKPNSMSVTATDMEVELVVDIAVKLEQTTRLTLPAKKLLDICRALPEGATLEFDIQNEKALIKSGKSRFTLAMLPAQEYPVIDITDETTDFSVNQEKLINLLANTQFAMAQQDVRYYLNGLLLEISSNNLKAVATDGHRLAFDETEIKASTNESKQIIVPRKGVTELMRLLQAGQDDASVKVSKNHMQVRSGNLSFTSKLIDGKFPDYQRVIPEFSETVVIASREELKNSLSRASILSNEKYRGVRVIFNENALRILAHNPDKEEAEEEVSVEYSGEEMEIGFNVSYLIDALSAIKTEKVKLSVLNPNSSCLITPEQKARCQYVVMPMKL
jgi:DNA polymerase-3 subunit beta